MKNKLSLPVIGLVLTAVMFCGIRYGSASLDPGTFLAALLRKPGAETESVILYAVRIPRVLAGVTAGAGLALSGVLLQAVTDNDLASPGIIGVNAGAGFAVVLCLVFLPGAALFFPAAAFAGACLTTLLITALAGRNSRSAVILAGVAVSSVLSASISAFTYVDTDLLAAYNAFSVGGLRGVEADQLWMPAAMIGICFGAAMIVSRQIDLLCLGESGAAVLGVPVKRIRLLCIFCASASAGAAVSFAGLLGFVGLIVPHIARKLVGSRTSRLIPASVMLGAAVTVSADLAGRILASPSEIPVGIMMAFIGGPFFLFLLIRRRKEEPWS